MNFSRASRTTRPAGDLPGGVSPYSPFQSQTRSRNFRARSPCARSRRRAARAPPASASRCPRGPSPAATASGGRACGGSAHDVLERDEHGVAHVQLAGDVGRRHRDDEALLVRVLRRLEVLPTPTTVQPLLDPSASTASPSPPTRPRRRGRRTRLLQTGRRARLAVNSRHVRLRRSHIAFSCTPPRRVIEDAGDAAAAAELPPIKGGGASEAAEECARRGRRACRATSATAATPRSVGIEMSHESRRGMSPERSRTEERSRKAEQVEVGSRRREGRPKQFPTPLKTIAKWGKRGQLLLSASAPPTKGDDGATGTTNTRVVSPHLALAAVSGSSPAGRRALRRRARAPLPERSSLPSASPPARARARALSADRAASRSLAVSQCRRRLARSASSSRMACSSPS